jgi:hypothetical protein
MDNEQKKQPAGKTKSQPYTFSDEVTKNKIKKHINDIRDVITEEDIANAKVPGEEEALPVQPEEENKDGNKHKIPGEGKPMTPWDILD